MLPFRQYKIRMDGSRRITLRNRQFLRKYKPLLVEDGPRSSHPPAGRSEPRPASPVKTVAQNPVAVSLRQQSVPRNPVLSEDEDNMPRLVPEEASTTLPQPVFDPTPAPGAEAGLRPSTPHPVTTEVQRQGPIGSHAEQPGYEDQITPQPPQPRRSSRHTMGQTKRFADSYTGQDYEEATNTVGSTLWGITATEDELQIPLIIGEIVGADGYLMALPLPRIYWDKSVWWTTEGWAWIQH